MQNNFQHHTSHINPHKVSDISATTGQQQHYTASMFSYNNSTSTNINNKSTATTVSRTPTCTNASHHPKKSRTVFTKKQIQELENVFYQKRYLTIKDREELSRRLTLTESQVKVWFQNRRNKWKREMAYKVEFAKFNILPNLNGGVGAAAVGGGGGGNPVTDGNNLPNGGVLLPSKTATTEGTTDFQIHHMINNNSTTYDDYTQRSDYTEAYPHHQFSSMFNQGSPEYQQHHQQQMHQSYSPFSNTGSPTNDQQLNYQQHHNHHQSEITSSSPLSHHQNLLAVNHQIGGAEEGAEGPSHLMLNIPTTSNSATGSAIYHYQDTNHYSTFQINNNLYSYQQHQNQEDLPPSPVYQQTQYGSSYEVSRYPRMHHQSITDYSLSQPQHQTTANSFSSQSTTVTKAPSCRGIYTDVTGVVYTTLTDCRYADNHQTLNLPDQNSSSY